MNARAENMIEESTDRIERSVVLNAPRARVWQALTNAEEFGDWFGANLKGQTFAQGQRARGHLTYRATRNISSTSSSTASSRRI